MSRRVVAAWLVVVVLAVAGLVGLAELLRHEHPAAGPRTPELDTEVDPLRDEVECPLAPGREGQEREQMGNQPAVPTPVTSNELYDCPGTWDGQRVVYVGEAVGAVLHRGDRAWLQLNDDVYADGIGPLPTHRDFRGGNAGVGAIVDAAQAAQVEAVGGPTQRGDLVEVVATFQRVDPETGEVAILDVESLEVIRPGEPFTAPRAPARPWVAGVAAAAALAVVVVERVRPAARSAERRADRDEP